MLDYRGSQEADEGQKLFGKKFRRTRTPWTESVSGGCLTWLRNS